MPWACGIPSLPAHFEAQPCKPPTVALLAIAMPYHLTIQFLHLSSYRSIPPSHPNLSHQLWVILLESTSVFVGQRTEQVKTGQVNPDRPLVGPSVDTFVGCFVGSPRRAENREISPRGCSRGPTRGSNFAFACSVCRPFVLESKHFQSNIVLKRCRPNICGMGCGFLNAIGGFLLLTIQLLFGLKLFWELFCFPQNRCG